MQQLQFSSQQIQLFSSTNPLIQKVGFSLCLCSHPMHTSAFKLAWYKCSRKAKFKELLRSKSREGCTLCQVLVIQPGKKQQVSHSSISVHPAFSTDFSDLIVLQSILHFAPSTIHTHIPQVPPALGRFVMVLCVCQQYMQLLLWHSRAALALAGGKGETWDATEGLPLGCATVITLPWQQLPQVLLPPHNRMENVIVPHPGTGFLCTDSSCHWRPSQSSLGCIHQFCKTPISNQKCKDNIKSILGIP